MNEILEQTLEGVTEYSTIVTMIAEMFTKIDTSPIEVEETIREEADKMGFDFSEFEGSIFKQMSIKEE